MEIGEISLIVASLIFIITFAFGWVYRRGYRRGINDGYNYVMKQIEDHYKRVEE